MTRRIPQVSFPGVRIAEIGEDNIAARFEFAIAFLDQCYAKEDLAVDRRNDHRVVC